MNMQEAFDKNWQHFIVDLKPPGAKASGDCVLRTEDGCPCAVGVLINDEDYVGELEDLGISQLVTRFPYLPNGKVYVEGIDRTVSFLGELQNAHDDAVGPHFHSAFERHLRRLARNFTLEVPEND